MKCRRGGGDWALGLIGTEPRMSGRTTVTLSVESSLTPFGRAWTGFWGKDGLGGESWSRRNRKSGDSKLHWAVATSCQSMSPSSWIAPRSDRRLHSHILGFWQTRESHQVCTDIGTRLRRILCRKQSGGEKTSLTYHKGPH